MQTNSVDVARIPTNGSGEVSGLMALIDSGALEPSSIVAVLAKTEGNGGVNDFTSECAVVALCNALSPRFALARARSRAKSRSSCRAARRACSLRTSQYSPALEVRRLLPIAQASGLGIA